jgi:serine/threonine protein kinase
MVDPNEPTVAEDALAAFRAQSTPAPTAPTIPGYVIDRRIGSGGMGDVWLARHQTLDRVVALKVVRSDLANDPNYVDRFLWSPFTMLGKLLGIYSSPWNTFPVATRMTVSMSGR